MKFRAHILLLAGGCVLACAAAPDAATAPDTTTLKPIVAGETTGPHAAAFAPSAYFNANCARCHGENGSAYGADFTKNKSDDALRTVVEEMADGPGQAPLAPAELDAVTAWHRALRDKKPFVIIVKSEKKAEGWQLSGEVSPGATLQINGKDIKVKNANWTAQVEAGAIQLRATTGETSTELDANIAAWAP